MTNSEKYLTELLRVYEALLATIGISPKPNIEQKLVLLRLAANVADLNVSIKSEETFR